MQLTQKQEAVVSRYLRDVAVSLDHGLPPKHRERVLERLQLRIKREVEQLHKTPITDDDLDGILTELGAPDAQAEELAAPMEHGRRLALSTYHRAWLGVCAGIAAHLGLEIWVVRAAAVAFGLVTGPIALIVYIAVYLYLYFTSPNRATPRIDGVRVAQRAAATIAIALVLFWGSAYAIRAIEFVYFRFNDPPMPDLKSWGWLYQSNDSYCFMALMIATPFAVLSALPLANGWDHSLKRLSQAVLALYGITLSFGLASIIVGILLNFVHEVSGGAGGHISDLLKR